MLNPCILGRVWGRWENNPFQKNLTEALAVNGECPKHCLNAAKQFPNVHEKINVLYSFMRKIISIIPQSNFFWITRHSRRVIPSKFFERVWENFCSQKFSQFPLSQFPFSFLMEFP